MRIQKKQCATCPWKKSTRPFADIPGYGLELHERLQQTVIAKPGQLSSTAIMACHKTSIGHEKACAGWLHNQLGPGNNIPLRLVFLGRYPRLLLDGDQHPAFEDTIKGL